MCVVSGGAGGLVDPTLVRVTDLSRTLGDNLAMRVRKKLRQDYYYPLGDAVSQKTKKAKPIKLWNVPCAHSLPTGSRRQAVPKPGRVAAGGAEQLDQGAACGPDLGSGRSESSSLSSASPDSSDGTSVTDPGASSTSSGFRACDLSFGNACFATGTLGLVIAGVAVSAIATGEYQIPRRKLLIRNTVPKRASKDVDSIAKGSKHVKTDDAGGADSTNESDCTCGKPNVKNNFNSSEFCVPVTGLPTGSDRQSTATVTTNSVSESPTGSLDSVPAAGTSSSVSSNIESPSVPTPVAGTMVSEAVFNQLFPSSSVPLIDAHCHLQLSPLWEDAPAAVALAQRVGVKHLVVCGTAPGEDWERVQELSRRFPDLVRATYGLHPWRIASQAASELSSPPSAVAAESTLASASSSSCPWLPSVMGRLETMLQTDPLAGVGECGLDKSIRKEASLELQQKILHAHFQLAKRYRRSITLHCVGAWGRLYDTVLEHCRVTDLRTAAQTGSGSGSGSHSEAIGNGFDGGEGRIKSVVLHCCNSLPIEFVPLFAAVPEVYFSLTMKSFSEKEAALCRAIPLTRLLLETDSPDQLPVEFRRPRVSQSPSVSIDNAILSSANVGTFPDTRNLSTSVTTKAAIPSFDYNQPALLHHGAQKVARILNLELAQLASITYENTLRAFI